MSWVKRLTAGVVAALRCAQQEDAQVEAGFARRVEALITREAPLVASQVPPGDPSVWDRPSEQTVRVVPPASVSAVLVQPDGRFDATPLRHAASRR